MRLSGYLRSKSIVPGQTWAPPVVQPCKLWGQLAGFIIRVCSCDRQPEEPREGDFVFRATPMNPPASDETPRRRPRGLQLDQLYETLQQETPKLANLRTNSVGIKLALIPAGAFAMGSPASEAFHRLNEAPA